MLIKGIITGSIATHSSQTQNKQLLISYLAKSYTNTSALQVCQVQCTKCSFRIFPDFSCIRAKSSRFLSVQKQRNTEGQSRQYIIYPHIFIYTCCMKGRDRQEAKDKEKGRYSWQQKEHRKGKKKSPNPTVVQACQIYLFYKSQSPLRWLFLTSQATHNPKTWIYYY